MEYCLVLKKIHIQCNTYYIVFYNTLQTYSKPRRENTNVFKDLSTIPKPFYDTLPRSRRSSAEVFETAQHLKTSTITVKSIPKPFYSKSDSFARLKEARNGNSSALENINNHSDIYSKTFYSTSDSFARLKEARNGNSSALENINNHSDIYSKTFFTAHQTHLRDLRRRGMETAQHLKTSTITVISIPKPFYSTSDSFARLKEVR